MSTARWHAFQECGFHCEPPCYSSNGKPSNPTKKDRISLTHKLFIEDRIKIHGERCRHGSYSLVKALETQKRAEDGTAEKKSGNASDRWTSSTDALGYGIWAAFSDEVSPPPARIVSW